MIKVLILEDTDDLSELFMVVFQQAGIAAKATATWRDFVCNLFEYIPDVIVLDIHLPEHSGYWILEHMEMLGIKTPVIVCSAFTDNTSATRVLEYYKCAASLTKPFNPEQLVELVRERVGKKDLAHHS